MSSTDSSTKLTQRKQESSSSSKLGAVAETAGSTIVSTYHALNDSQPHYILHSSYSTVRHTRPWVYYRGTSTNVPITLLGSRHLTQVPLKVTLQRRGWRTGLLGWTVGSWLGGTINKEVDVTPIDKGDWIKDVDSKQRAQFDKEIKEFTESSVAPYPAHFPLETMFVHIPVSVGDGYFRLVLYSGGTKGATANKFSTTPIAYSASFRVGSLSLSSAQPRGASPLTIVPELLLRSGSVAANTTAWAAFYTAFPLLKVVQMMPGSQSWAGWAYRWAGGESKTRELTERYRVEERRKNAEQSMYRNVPFGAAGVRTAYDLQEDAKRGRGGVRFPRS